MQRVTVRAVTTFGGVGVFVDYPRKADLVGRVGERMPVQKQSPKQIEATATF